MSSSITEIQVNISMLSLHLLQLRGSGFLRRRVAEIDVKHVPKLVIPWMAKKKQCALNLELDVRI